MTTQSIDVIASGINSVTVTSASGCNLVCAPANVIVMPRPIATVSAAGPTIYCPGGNVQLNAGGGTTYHWNTSSTASSVTVSSAGYYWVTATTNGCSDVSDSIHVTVYTAPPTPTITQSSDTLYANPATGYIYQLYLNSTPISGATNNYYHPLSDGLYYVQITDGNSCIKLSSGYNYVWVGLSGAIDNIAVSVYPNPFNYTCNLVFKLEKESYLKVELFDLLGQKVAVIDNSERAAGLMRYTLDKEKAGLVPRSYFISVKINDTILTLKIMVQ